MKIWNYKFDCDIKYNKLITLWDLTSRPTGRTMNVTPNRKTECWILGEIKLIDLQRQSLQWFESGSTSEISPQGCWYPATIKPVCLPIGVFKHWCNFYLANIHDIHHKELSTLKANGWIVFILLWSSVIFFKFFNPLNAWKYIYIIFVSSYSSFSLPHLLRWLNICLF